MKKTFYTLLLLLSILTLAACGSTGEENSAASTNGGTTTNQGNISLEMELMLGTVKLDETEYAIDNQQATELLPLWKALRSLSGSETAAQAEIDAVIAAIEDGMTSEQMEAIGTMELSMADMADVAEILGIEIGGGGRFGEMTPEMQATMEAMRESGEGPPEGFGPGGGLGQGGGQGPGGGDTGITQEMRETAIAGRGGNLGRGFGINTQLLEAIIAFLEAK